MRHPASGPAAVVADGFRLAGARTPANDQTEARLVFDRNNLYIAVTCRDSDMATVQKGCAERTRADAWTVEVAIPFAGLGLKGPPFGKTWRANICRVNRTPRREVSSWSGIEQHFHEPNSFGKWTFLETGD